MSRDPVHFGSPVGATYSAPEEPAPKPMLHFGSPAEGDK